MKAADLLGQVGFSFGLFWDHQFKICGNLHLHCAPMQSVAKSLSAL
jgi:hypothetical protein